MDQDELIAIRKRLGLTQAEMADCIGMKRRAYSDLETGKSEVRPIHRLAAERIALKIAVERQDATLVPETIRQDAILLSALLKGSP